MFNINAFGVTVFACALPFLAGAEVMQAPPPGSPAAIYAQCMSDTPKASLAVYCVSFRNDVSVQVQSCMQREQKAQTSSHGYKARYLRCTTEVEKKFALIGR